VDRTLVAGEPYPDFDYYIHLMSLPKVFGTDVGSIPAAVPYLVPSLERTEEWGRRIGGQGVCNVGIVWAGDAAHVRDRHRSIPLSAFAPLAKIQGVRFYSLQKGAQASELSTSSAGLTPVDLGPDLRDFADTAAAIVHLDLVITVDTSVAHLAGALGKPVWVLLPTPADWRWMTGRDDSPWYPTMRLFRQRRQGDWQEVILRVKEALAEVRTSRTASTGQVSAITQNGAKETLNPPSDRVRPKELSGLCAVAETVAGIVQYFPDEPLIGKSIEYYGEYLQPQIELLKRLIKPGASVMEIGSGVGMHVLAMSPAVGESGHFFLYEDRSLFQSVLRQNLAANRIANVTVMKRSLATRKPLVDNGEKHNPAGRVGASASSASMETTDELQLDALHWIKINEEHDALGILDVAANSLWRLRPSLFIAVTDHESIDEIVVRLRDFGYRCWKMASHRFNPANFNRQEINVFSGQIAWATLAMPEESGVDIALDECVRLT